MHMIFHAPQMYIYMYMHVHTHFFYYFHTTVSHTHNASKYMYTYTHSNDDRLVVFQWLEDQSRHQEFGADRESYLLLHTASP